MYRFIQKLYHNNLGVPVIMTHCVELLTEYHFLSELHESRSFSGSCLASSISLYIHITYYVNFISTGATVILFSTCFTKGIIFETDKIKQVVKVIYVRPHRRRTWSVQSYLPSGVNVHPHLIHGSLGPPESTFNTPNSISIGSAVF